MESGRPRDRPHRLPAPRQEGQHPARGQEEAPHAPVSKRLLRYLKMAYRFRKGDYVVMHRGDRLKSVKFAFMAACKRAKIKGVTPHTMKHTYITWLLRARVPV